ncbi:hypothetical protein PR048_001283 [Dryococelus australis]|uniref:Transposase n=1 Tax=Dryococelus australis TaxID=614101 RepID=A0ABQ9IHL1_9NEOP|nr:hypothetical protein PR048_001283 [Dryococelus australis]
MKGLVEYKFFCFISDCLEHTTVVYAFQQKLVAKLKEDFPQTNKIIHFSDGAGGQYKNKKNFINLCYHEIDFHLQAEWNFFGTSHGKSPCDGIGGTVKHLISKASYQRTSIGQIFTAEDMFVFCQANINERRSRFNRLFLEERFKDAKRVPGTRQKHRFVPLEGRGCIRSFITSKTVKYEDVKIEHTVDSISVVKPERIKEREFVPGIYDKNWCIAEVVHVNMDDEDCDVHLYHPPGPAASFLKSRNDKPRMPFTNIVCVLTAWEFSVMTGRGRRLDVNVGNELTEILRVEDHPRLNQRTRRGMEAIPNSQERRRGKSKRGDKSEAAARQSVATNDIRNAVGARFDLQRTRSLHIHTESSHGSERNGRGGGIDKPPGKRT